jgi:hypothetical protein
MEVKRGEGVGSCVVRGAIHVGKERAARDIAGFRHLPESDGGRNGPVGCERTLCLLAYV